MEHFRFHVVGLPHTEVTKEFLPCAYTQKVRNFCKMMKSLGHEVFLYAGGDKTDVDVDKFTSIVSPEEQEKYFGHTDWRKDFFPINWGGNEAYWISSNLKAIHAIKDTIKEKDFICVIAGFCQQPIAEHFPAHQTIEFGVGYSGIFSNFRVFESYAWMHYVYGMKNITDGRAYDTVIPNYFDPADFPFSEEKDDYYLFVGRMVSRKGPHVAAEITEAIGAKLIMAGQGVISKEPGKIVANELTLLGGNIEHVGVVGVEERGKLMSRAKALFVPTQYIGPFEGVSIEAMMCGTPVISTDWGCFAENVIEGITGFRTRTLGEGIWAAKNVDKLNPKRIRAFAEANFSLDRVKMQYQGYFESLMQLWDKGWYSHEYNPINMRYFKHNVNE